MMQAEQVALEDYLAEQQQIVEKTLQQWVPNESVSPSSIHSAMRYSLFAGGKRIRPVLAIAAARAVDPEPDGVEHAAITLELVHTYSLIHDDLPAMDNDDLRRGRPTCHKVFGEAMAILAGDSLLTLAFEVLSRLPAVSAERKIRLVEELSRSSGTVGGMVGGQVHDIEGEGKTPTADLLETIHRAKTGALLRASLRMGGTYAGASEAEFEALSSFGEHIGLAFQIIDDVLDIEGSAEALGKTAGKDLTQQKITFPAVYGIGESRRMAEEQRLAAHKSLKIFGDKAERLLQLADLVVQRST